MTAQKNHWSDKRKIYVSIFRHRCQRLYHQYDAQDPSNLQSVSSQ